MSFSAFFVKPKVFIPLIVLAAILIIWGVSAGSEAPSEKPEERIKKVSLLNIEQHTGDSFRVETSGQVESLEQVELRSEVAARIISVPAELGQKVRVGQVLARFDSAALSAQLAQASAQLESLQASSVQVEAGVTAQEARLQDIQNGATEEQLNLARTQVASAEKSFENVTNNLKLTKEKAATDIENAYASAITSAAQSVTSATDSLAWLSYVQYSNLLLNEVTEIENAKAVAVLELLGGENGGVIWKDYLYLMTGGAKGLVSGAQNDPTNQNRATALNAVSSALQKVKDVLNQIPISSRLASVDAVNLATEKASVDALITITDGSNQGIAALQAANNSIIAGVETQLTQAESGLALAQQQLELTLAGATAEQIQAQESQLQQAQGGVLSHQAQIKSARASVAAVQAQISKTIVRSPIAGTIATLTLKAGELVSPGALVASVVNTDGLQVKAFIDSTKRSVIDKGSSVVIEDVYTGVVTNISPSIDPLTKKVEVLIAIDNSQDLPLVVGQFVDVTIEFTETAKETNSLFLPLQAVRVGQDQASVFLVNEEGMVEDQGVVLGVVIGDQVEVLDGLTDTVEIISSVRGLETGERVEAQ